MNALEETIVQLQVEMSDEIAKVSQIVSIFSLMRKIIDIERIPNTSNDYPYIHLYSNWLLHHKIDENSQAWKILKLIDKDMKGYFEVGDPGIEKHLIPMSLRFSNLYEEIERFIHEYNLPELFLDKDSWERKIKLLLSRLIRVPLLPKEKDESKLEYVLGIYYIPARDAVVPKDPGRRRYPTLRIIIRNRGRGEFFDFESREPVNYSEKVTNNQKVFRNVE